jgi:hypothetical protein
MRVEVFLLILYLCLLVDKVWGREALKWLFRP